METRSRSSILEDVSGESAQWDGRIQSLAPYPQETSLIAAPDHVTQNSVVRNWILVLFVGVGLLLFGGVGGILLGVPLSIVAFIFTLLASKAEINENLPAVSKYLKYAQSLLCLGVAVSVVAYMLIYTIILYTFIVLGALTSE